MALKKLIQLLVEKMRGETLSEEQKTTLRNIQIYHQSDIIDGNPIQTNGNLPFEFQDSQEKLEVIKEMILESGFKNIESEKPQYANIAVRLFVGITAETNYISSIYVEGANVFTKQNGNFISNWGTNREPILLTAPLIISFHPLPDETVKAYCSTRTYYFKVS